MKMYVFCVKDRAVDAFGNPMYAVAPGQALRSFTDEVNRAAEDNQLYRHPDDFDLYELGLFDTQLGVFECGVPRVVARGKDVSSKVSEVN